MSDVEIFLKTETYFQIDNLSAFLHSFLDVSRFISCPLYKSNDTLNK